MGYDGFNKHQPRLSQNPVLALLLMIHLLSATLMD